MKSRYWMTAIFVTVLGLGLMPWTVYAAPPEPTPDTSLPWIGIGQLTRVTNDKYKQWECTFQPSRPGLADQQCHPVIKEQTDWDAGETKYGTVAGNFDTYPPGTAYLWASWSNQSSHFDSHLQDMTGLAEVPYEDFTSGAAQTTSMLTPSPRTPIFQTCNNTNVTPLQASSISKDWFSKGGQGTGLCGLSCPRQSFVIGYCWKQVGYCTGIAGCCWCNDDIGRYTLPFGSTDNSGCTTITDYCKLSTNAEGIRTNGSIFR